MKLGVIVLALFALIVGSLCIIIIRLLHKKYPVFEKLLLRMKIIENALFWNQTCRFILEGYLNGSIQALETL